MEDKLIAPDNCTATQEKDFVVVKGPKGEIKKKLTDKKVKVKQEAQEIIIIYPEDTKRAKRLLNTNKAHIKNMVQGVNEGFIYKLKICSGHFPMNVSMKNNVLEVKNFIGEKVPRALRISPDAKVSVSGDQIVVEATSKEVAGQVAASIEKLTFRPGFDKRIFQDGIYITEKAGKKITH
jgi:large subunit ribosomal protein L6